MNRGLTGARSCRSEAEHDHLNGSSDSTHREIIAHRPGAARCMLGRSAGPCHILLRRAVGLGRCRPSRGHCGNVGWG